MARTVNRYNAGEVIAELFSECTLSSRSRLCDDSTDWAHLLDLGLASVTRFILTVFTFGMKVPAGLFIPSMSIGASFGRIVGTLVKIFYKYVHVATRVYLCTNVSTHHHARCCLLALTVTIRICSSLLSAPRTPSVSRLECMH
jgi:H+/Cl- antiporter ClcA